MRLLRNFSPFAPREKVAGGRMSGMPTSGLNCNFQRFRNAPKSKRYSPTPLTPVAPCRTLNIDQPLILIPREPHPRI